MTAGGYLILYNYMIGAFLSVATRDTFWLCLFLFSSGSHLEATHGLVVAFVALCSDRSGQYDCVIESKLNNCWCVC